MTKTIVIPAEILAINRKKRRIGRLIRMRKELRAACQKTALVGKDK